LRGAGQVEQWDCQTGGRSALASVQTDRGVEVTLDFPPSGQCVLRLVEQRDETLRQAEVLVEQRRFPLPGPFPFTLDEPNVCVLDRARWRLGSGAWRPQAEILKIDQALREELGLAQRGGQMVQPWYAKHVERPVLGLLELGFEFDLDAAVTGGEMELALELPGLWQIRVNGTPLDPAGKRGWWVDTCFEKLPVPAAALRAGRNEVQLTAEFRDGLDLEAIYLLGDFGVRVSGTDRTLSALPAMLDVGEVTTQGLPFYGGRIKYRLPRLPSAFEEERTFVEAPGFEAACIVVEDASGAAGLIAWQPYEVELGAGAERVAFDVVLTRRNTFGPLHALPLRAGAYGPGNFRTTGQNWTDEYVLYPAGLLQEPAVSFRAPGAIR
jgi:hypothetical protein